MLKNKFRILLIVLSFSTGILFYTQEEFLKAFLFIIAGCLFIYGYYRYSNIWLIFNHIKRNEFERAELLLNDIKSIEVLNSQSKAYYYFSKGIVEDNKNNLAEAEKNYLNSLKYNLRTENDKSIINLNLANIYFRKKMFEEAKVRIINAENFSHKTVMDGEIKRLKDIVLNKT